MRRPLTQEEKEDAQRLRRVYDQKARDMGTSQALIAKEFGFANPSAVSQYLCGRIPLNLNAVTKFAHYFDVPLKTISPRFAAAVENSSEQSPILQALGLTPNSELLPATDQAKTILGDFDYFVVDKTQTVLGAGTFIVGGVGADTRAVKVRVGGDMLHISGLADFGYETPLPAVAAPLINVEGRVVLLVKKL